MKLKVQSSKLEGKDRIPSNFQLSASSFQLYSCTPQGPRGAAQRRNRAFGEAVYRVSAL
jgi:hypothetical protein